MNTDRINRRAVIYGGAAIGVSALALGVGAFLERMGVINIIPDRDRVSNPGDLGEALAATAFSTETPAPTATSIPTETLPPAPAESPTPTPGYFSSPYTGELPFNSLRVLYGENVIEAVMGGLELRARNNSTARLDSTLSSLTNEFNPELFGIDPRTEPGFGHTERDITGHLSVQEVISERGETTLSELLTLNANGIISMELTGKEDDRDAALAIFATEQAFLNHELNGFNGTNTLAEVFADPEAVAKVKVIQARMLAMIQKQSLEVSQEEALDRASGEVNDASAGLPEALQIPDQSLSCDVYRPDASTREDQLQALREVVHKADIEDTFTEANSSEEQTLWVWSRDATGKFKVGAFSLRSYSGPVAGQENSVVGEQKLPCGPGEVGEQPGVPVRPTVIEKGPDPHDGDDASRGDRGSGDTGNPGTGTGEH